jgi:hypothetical protein
VTVGLPGSGIYWTEQAPPGPAIHGGHRLAFIIIAAIVVLFVIGKIARVAGG